MKLTILSTDGICFLEGEVFELHGDVVPFILDEEDTEYPLSDLILDGVEFKVTKD